MPIPQVSLDCELGSACERTYRIILARAEAQTGTAELVGWTVSAGIEYAQSHYGQCGPPGDARVDLEAEPATRAAGEGFAHGVIGPVEIKSERDVSDECDRVPLSSTPRGHPSLWPAGFTLSSTVVGVSMGVKSKR